MAVPSNLPPRKNVYQAAAEYRQRLLAREQDTVDDTVRRWLIARHQIEKELDQLIGRVEAALAAGKRPVVLPFGGNFGPDEFSASWLYRVGRLETLAATIEGELAKFNQDGLAKIASRAKTEVGAGELDAQNLLRFRVRDDGLISPRNFAALPTGALEQITAMVGPGGPLPKAFNGMSADLIQKVQQRLVDGIAKGENPRVVGRKMLQDTEDGGLLDTPLYKQVRVARTEPIRAYRESGRLTYLANSDVVTAWEWRAFPGQRTCPYCLAMDGSIHPLDQPMATHPQCRCTQLPVTELSDAPEFTGAEYLYRLSASEQDEVFGSHTMGELYRSGKVRLSDIPEQFQHEDWGRSGRAASLRSLQGRGVITQDDIVQARESRTARPVWSFAGTQPFQPTQFIPAVPSTAPVAPAPVQLPPTPDPTPAESKLDVNTLPENERRGWSGSMSRKEAEQWAKDSVIKEPMYHVTRPNAIESMMQEGFKLEGTRWARVWGEGVYMTDSEDVLDFYRNIKSTSETLELRVNLKKVLVVNADDKRGYEFWRDALRSIDFETRADYDMTEERVVKLAKELYDQKRAIVRSALDNGANAESVRNQLREKFGTSDSYDWSSDAFEWYIVQAFLKRQGYDALKVLDPGKPFTSSIGGNQLVVFDVRNVVIIKK